MFASLCADYISDQFSWGKTRIFSKYKSPKWWKTNHIDDVDGKMRNVNYFYHFWRGMNHKSIITVVPTTINHWSANITCTRNQIQTNKQKHYMILITYWHALKSKANWNNIHRDIKQWDDVQNVLIIINSHRKSGARLQ